MVFRANKERLEEKERVRTELLRAALRLAAQHGFASLGLREVAREAGIAPTSFYRHFADMQEVGVALSREVVRDAVAQVCSSIARDPEHACSALLDMMLALAVRDPELMRFMLAERTGANQGLRASLGAELAPLSKALTKHSPERELPSTAAAADAAVAVVLDACAYALDPPRAPAPATPMTMDAARRRSYAQAVQRLLEVAPLDGEPQRSRSRSHVTGTAAAKEDP